MADAADVQRTIQGQLPQAIMRMAVGPDVVLIDHTSKGVWTRSGQALASYAVSCRT